MTTHAKRLAVLEAALASATHQLATQSLTPEERSRLAREANLILTKINTLSENAA